MSRQPLIFVPFENSTSGDSVLGYRANATYLDLVNEADMRQGAAKRLLGLLSCLADFEQSHSAEIAGCFNAVRFLVEDASALQDAAHQCWQRELQGGAQ